MARCIFLVDFILIPKQFAVASKAETLFEQRSLTKSIPNLPDFLLVLQLA